MHIHAQHVIAVPVLDGDKALQLHELSAIAGHGALQRTVQRIGVLPAEGGGQHLRQQELAEVQLPLALGDEQTAEQQGTSSGVLADDAAEGRVVQPRKQVLGVQTAVGRGAQHLAADAVAQQHELVAAVHQTAAHGGGRGGEDPLKQGVCPFLRAGAGDEGQILGPQHRLVLRLPQVQSLPVDELLRHGVDEVGYIPVGVHRLPDAGGADLLQLGRQRQLHHMAGDAAVVRRLGARLGAAEDHMVEGVDGVRRGRFAVGGGVGYHVAAHHDGYAPSRKCLPQTAQVVGIGDVHREILREKVDVELVGHGHGRDAAADAGGLCALGPGEFVDGQQHLEARIPDGADDALVGQGEGIESAGEERHRPGRAEVKALPEQLLLCHEAVELAQHGGPVVERQPVVRLLVVGGQQLALRQHKGAALLMIAQLRRSEDPAAQHIQSLLPHGVVDAVQTPHQHTQQPLTAAAIGVVRLREAGAVGVIRLIDDAHGIQHGGGHPAVGGAEVDPQVVQYLIQLGGRQPQGEAAQIVGDIFGELLLPQLQTAAQLHRHLVALIHRQPGRQLQQGAAGAVAHGDTVADLDEVGQMGGDMQRGAAAAAGKVRQQADICLLGDPRRGGFQIVQKDLGYGVIRQGDGGAVLQHILPQQPEGSAAAAVHARQRTQRSGGSGRRAAQAIQQQHGGGTHLHVLPDREGLREPQQQRPVAGIHRVRQGDRRVQKLERRGVIQLVGAAVVGEQRRQEALLPPGGMPEQGGDCKFQGIADPAAMLGHQLVVGIDDLVQIQLPLIQIGDAAWVGTAAGGTLLGVAGVETADDLTQQRRRLSADVALPVHQQLIEKGQSLYLLGDVQVQGVGFKHAQIGAETAPVGFAAGQLQQPGKAALAGKAAHQLHIVPHALHGQGVEGLIIGHEGSLLLRTGRCVMPLQRYIHAPVDHELLKVPQPGIDPHIPAALGVVHAVQLG